MPRVSVRKLSIYFLFVVSLFLLAINIHHQSPRFFEFDLDEEDVKFQPQRRALDGSLLHPKDKVIPGLERRPWYMKGGLLRPKKASNNDDFSRLSAVFPQDLPGHDRIPEQLMFIPTNGSSEVIQDSQKLKLKKILFWGRSWSSLKPGQGVFIEEKCPISTCEVTNSRLDSVKADLVIFKDRFTTPTFHRPSHQLWMLYMLECPLNTQMFHSKNVFNWTATYRSDSTIVAPYERWQYYNENVRKLDQNKNFAANKTKAVAWFVSNCKARNGRLEYAKELQKYIQVDIYGSCGTHQCPRAKSVECFNVLERDYKFYLAFENSNCIDYITEKFYVNGLMHDLVPIVMGARPQDYARSAPDHSYIHVDDFESPKELAEYLDKLDKNDDLYNEYFKWRGTGEFINTKFFCRVCSMLHNPKVENSISNYEDINDWWRGAGTCIKGSWKKFEKAWAAAKVIQETKKNEVSSAP